MQYAYDPYILWRKAGNRIFIVNSTISFEYVMNCFQAEQPFFLVSQLEDGRVAITPNFMYIPWNLLQTGFWPQDLLPGDCEYVTMKHGTYPVIITAHPMKSFDKWFADFTRCVEIFAQQTLAQFVSAAPAYEPVRLEEGAKMAAKETVLC